MVKVKNSNSSCKNVLGPTDGHVSKETGSSSRLNASCGCIKNNQWKKECSIIEVQSELIYTYGMQK